MSGATKLMTAGGGGVSLTPASSIASDVTVNVPSQNCTLGIQGPTFSAYQNSAQSISASTWTKVLFQAEEWDTNSNFASSRFTPTVAGYYQISWGVATAISGDFFASLYKNGSSARNGNKWDSSAIGQASNASALVYANGSTDYFEVYMYASGSGNLVADSINTYFTGALVRAA